MTLSELTDRHTSLLRQFEAWLGEMPPRGPLKTEETYRREYSSHTEIKLTYEGEPGERIPAYLLVPRDVALPRPGVLAVHQCACACDIGKEQVVGKSVDWPDQAYGLDLVRAGFVVLAPDSNLAGERCDTSLRPRWECAIPRFRPDGIWGQFSCCTAPRGPAGTVHWKRVYDAMRGIDLLTELPEVNSDHIGMIGHSRGAGITLSTMPWDTRISACVVSGAAPMPELVPYGYGLNYADMLTLIAPRPLLDVTGLRDGNARLTTEERMKPKRDAHAAAQEVYRRLNNPEGISCLEFDGGHEFPPEMRQASCAWFTRWLGT